MQVVTKRSSPLFTELFSIPSRRDIIPIDCGAILFGLGWGLGGVCPGPGLVSLFGGDTEICVFVSMMAAGMLLFQQICRDFNVPAALYQHLIREMISERCLCWLNHGWDAVHKATMLFGWIAG